MVAAHIRQIGGADVLSRRHFLGATGAVTVATVLGGCGGDDKAGSGDKTPATLQMTWWGSTDRHKRTQDALAEFRKKHPNITVRTQFSGWDGYWEKLATETAGGNPPDVIQMDYSYIAEYARRGALRPLDEFVPKVLDLGDFSEDSLAGGKIDNKLYGVNAGLNSMALVVNLSLAKQIGVEIPDNTMTWADFATFTKALGAKAPSGVFGAENGANDGAALECWLRQKGKGLFTADGALGFTPDDLTEWFTYWDDLRKAKGTPPADVQATAVGDVQNSLVARKKAVADFAHSNQLTAYANVLKDDLALHMYPQGGAGSKPGQYLKPSMLMSISAKSKHPKESAMLVDSLLTETSVAAILGSERGIPPSTSVRVALKPKASDVEQKTYAYIDFVTDKVGPLPAAYPLGAGEVTNKILTFASDQVGFGKATISQSVTRFFEDANRALKK
jgi:multiple sugar transport system substrate-binding protein